MVEMEKCAHLGVTVLRHHPIPHAFPGVLLAAESRNLHNFLCARLLVASD